MILFVGLVAQLTFAWSPAAVGTPEVSGPCAGVSALDRCLSRGLEDRVFLEVGPVRVPNALDHQAGM